MQNSSTDMVLTGQNRHSPVFVPRKGVLLREYHVLVTWPDGRRARIGKFCRRPDAQRWIDQKSAAWLALQLADETGDAPDDGARSGAFAGSLGN